MRLSEICIDSWQHFIQFLPISAILFVYSTPQFFVQYQLSSGGYHQEVTSNNASLAGVNSRGVSPRWSYELQLHAFDSPFLTRGARSGDSRCPGSCCRAPAPVLAQIPSVVNGTVCLSQLVVNRNVCVLQQTFLSHVSINGGR